MSYLKALEAAGATVHEYHSFGSWQGTILAHVTVDGIAGFIAIGYGSCSGCDSYESFTMKFDWDYQPTEKELAEFGKTYLEDVKTASAMIAELRKDEEWDSDIPPMIQWIEEKETK